MVLKDYFNKPSQLAPIFSHQVSWLLVALGSGILMGLTPAPANAWPLAWIALAPLWVITQQSIRLPGHLRYRLCCGLLWGLGYHGLALAWIRDLHPLTWMGVPWLASLAITGFCWLFITFWGAGLVMIWVGLVGYLGRDLASGLRVLLATALWCGLEALWGNGVLYWTSLSYTQSPFNLAILHLGQLSGPLTVTAAIVAFNGLLAEAWLHLSTPQTGTNFYRQYQAKRLLVIGLVGLVSLHLVGFILYSQPLNDAAAARFKIGIVQGNIPTRIKLFEQGLRLSLENYVKGYQSLVAEGVDAVLTSEGALPWLWINQPTDNALYRAIVARQVPAWVGTVGLRQGRVTQTLFSISGTGEIVGRYDKVKLVPLGEYIPFEATLGRLIGRLSPVGASMLPGRSDQRLESPFGQAIAGICYESAFPELFRYQAAIGGQFILTASNIDPYGRALMAQHSAQDVMRAIETSRWTARATNTGQSGIVDPHGRSQWQSGFRTYETHAHNLYRRQFQTLYVRWGNWLTPLLLGMALLGWLKSRTEIPHR
jgi:apolipoprotein N-acyltransferase